MTQPSGMYEDLPDSVVDALNELGEPPEQFVVVELPGYKTWRRSAGLLICRAVTHPEPPSEFPCKACLAHVDHVAKTPSVSPSS